MGATTFPQRFVQAVGESPWAERVAGVQQALAGPLTAQARRTPLHSGVLGHSVHPPLTDVTLGCWTSALLLDVVGGERSRRAATTLVAAGVVAAMPTAISGATDWAELTGTERRIGAVHALGTDIATFAFIGSLVARTRDRHGLGVALAAAGGTAMTGAGLLGGHLALVRGTARRTPTPEPVE